MSERRLGDKSREGLEVEFLTGLMKRDAEEWARKNQVTYGNEVHEDDDDQKPNGKIIDLKSKNAVSRPRGILTQPRDKTPKPATR